MPDKPTPSPKVPKPGRRADGTNLPGHCLNPNGRPAGTPNYTTLFHRALKKVQNDCKFDLFEEFVKQARLNPTLMVAAVRKLVPDKSEISFGTVELQQAQSAMLEVITRHVKDPAVLAAIAADLDALAEKAEEEMTGA